MLLLIAPQLSTIPGPFQHFVLWRIKTNANYERTITIEEKNSYVYETKNEKLTIMQNIQQIFTDSKPNVLILFSEENNQNKVIIRFQQK